MKDDDKAGNDGTAGVIAGGCLAMMLASSFAILGIGYELACWIARWP